MWKESHTHSSFLRPRHSSFSAKLCPFSKQMTHCLRWLDMKTAISPRTQLCLILNPEAESHSTIIGPAGRPRTPRPRASNLTMTRYCLAPSAPAVIYHPEPTTDRLG